MKHPGIVPVHDVGRDGKWVYIVSDLIEGCDLGTAAAQRRLPVAESARIAAAVADALQYAHRRGLVHRDVKPANILLDRDGNVFLTDFGIAATREQLQEGAVPSEGTLAYMAPEQIAATHDQSGPASDIYSLGTVLYELLTEQRPRVEEEDRLKPGVRAVSPPSAIDPTVPAALDTVCLRALAEKPGERYASAAELAAAIRRAIAPGPRRLLPAMIALATTALAIGVGLASWKGFWQQPGLPAAPADRQPLSVAPPPVVGATYFAGRYYKYFRGNVSWHEAHAAASSWAAACR